MRPVHALKAPSFKRNASISRAKSGRATGRSQSHTRRFAVSAQPPPFREVRGRLAAACRAHGGRCGHVCVGALKNSFRSRPAPRRRSIFLSRSSTPRRGARDVLAFAPSTFKAHRHCQSVGVHAIRTAVVGEASQGVPNGTPDESVTGDEPSLLASVSPNAAIRMPPGGLGEGEQRDLAMGR